MQLLKTVDSRCVGGDRIGEWPVEREQNRRTTVQLAPASYHSDTTGQGFSILPFATLSPPRNNCRTCVHQLPPHTAAVSRILKFGLKDL
ncbi:hypothetical protein ElyMa_002902900 [Elysia marginata]|uniref:Uncharacterized protein n=1 Tax=Elysia marginata TaxID=1093978 RepID=A0AAV4I1A9_9GAST|nr:hypothetical protein ElyMa_002902900 [Elysia marginata]